MFISDSHAVCGIMGVAGVAISYDGAVLCRGYRCLPSIMDVGSMFGVGVRVLMVVLGVSVEPTRQELRQ